MITPLQLSANRRHFVRPDGTPFFWLADTAWNGVLRSNPADWDRYLATRRQQGFTAIQFVMTDWRAYKGGQAFADGKVNESFFAHLDEKFAAVNGHGLVAAPVILWANEPDDPGMALSETDAILLANFIVHRYGTQDVVWILAGDGDYRGAKAARWRSIGRSVFGGRHDRLVTMHPGGQVWVADEFQDESWFDFVGYQSGHGASTAELRWLISGPPASAWQDATSRPILNLEPNYEFHSIYKSQHRFTDYEVRRGAWWSLLIAPPVGITYGTNPIWHWGEQTEITAGHPALGPTDPWHTGLDSPGVRNMTVLRRIMDRLPWWELEPAPAMLRDQPGDHDPREHIAVAHSRDDRWGLAYLPHGGRPEFVTEPSDFRWIDPRTGAETSSEPGDTDDWLLYFGNSQR